MLEANDQANSAQWQSDLDEHEKEASGNNTTFCIFPHVGLQPFFFSLLTDFTIVC